MHASAIDFNNIPTFRLPTEKKAVPVFVIPFTSEGAIVEVQISETRKRTNELQVQRALTNPPSPVLTRFVIDTGAARTMVNAGHLATLNPTELAKGIFHTPSTGDKPVECRQFEVNMGFFNVGQMPMLLEPISIAECPALTGSIHGILGRDILSKCLLIWNPFAGNVTLSVDFFLPQIQSSI